MKPALFTAGELKGIKTYLYNRSQRAKSNTESIAAERHLKAVNIALSRGEGNEKTIANALEIMATIVRRATDQATEIESLKKQIKKIEELMGK